MRLRRFLLRSAADRHADGTDHFRLLDLPPGKFKTLAGSYARPKLTITELRNIIYGFFFEDRDPKNLALLASCKQVRREAFVLALDRTIITWKPRHFLCHKTQFKPHWANVTAKKTRKLWDSTFRDAVTHVRCETFGAFGRLKWPLVSLMLKHAGVYPKHITVAVAPDHFVEFELGRDENHTLFLDGREFFDAVKHFAKRSSLLRYPAALHKVIVYHCMFSQFLKNPRLQTWELQRYRKDKKLDWTLRLERDGEQDRLCSHAMPPYSVIDADRATSRLLGVDVQVLRGWNGDEDMLVRVRHMEGTVGGCVHELVCVRMSLLMAGEPNEAVSTD